MVGISEDNVLKIRRVGGYENIQIVYWTPKGVTTYEISHSWRTFSVTCANQIAKGGLYADALTYVIMSAACI